MSDLLYPAPENRYHKQRVSLHEIWTLSLSYWEKTWSKENFRQKTINRSRYFLNRGFVGSSALSIESMTHKGVAESMQGTFISHSCIIPIFTVWDYKNLYCDNFFRVYFYTVCWRFLSSVSLGSEEITTVHTRFICSAHRQEQQCCFDGCFCHLNNVYLMSPCFPTLVSFYSFSIFLVSSCRSSGALFSLLISTCKNICNQFLFTE